MCSSYLEGVKHLIELGLGGWVVSASRPVPRLRLLRQPDHLLAVVHDRDHVVGEVCHARTIREVGVLFTTKKYNKFMIYIKSSSVLHYSTLRCGSK